MKAGTVAGYPGLKAGAWWREIAGLAAIAGFYLITVLPNIGNNPIAGGDEGWIMSASAKLAREGVFGSDLFAGFYGADRHYFFNLPLHHLVLAGVFKVFGVGLIQARLVSAAYGLATLGLTWALGRRLGGAGLGLLAAALLAVLRLNLAPFTGLTLTDLGATVRYDLIAIPYGLGATLLLLRRPAPGRREALLAGLLLGLASLTQFIGALFVLPATAFVLMLAVPLKRRLVLAAIMAFGLILPVLPYAAYATSQWQDFRGQARTAEQRSDFSSPSFYLDNLKREPDRFKLGTGSLNPGDGIAEVARRPSARLALYVVGPIAAVFVVARALGKLRESDGRRCQKAPAMAEEARPGQRVEYRLLALMLLGLSLELALFESTKRFVYWVAVVPFLCMAMGDLGLAAWRLRPASWSPYVLRAAVVLVGAVFAVEGLAVGLKNVHTAMDAPSYAGAGAELRRRLPPGSVVAGDNRLWLSLAGPAASEKGLHQPRSLHLLFYFTNPGISHDTATDVAGAMARIDADYLLLSPLSRDMLRNLSARDRADFERYLAANADIEATVLGPPYGPIDVYRLRR